MDKPTSMKVLTSFARLEYPLKADILGELAQKFVSSMPDMSPAEFAHFVWACVKLKNISTEQYSPKLPPRLIANVDGGVSKRLQKFHSNDIAKVRVFSFSVSKSLNGVCTDAQQIVYS